MSVDETSDIAGARAPHDPKYQLGDDDRVFHRAGGYYLPDDEPLVVFRGKDVGTLVAMEAYLRFMEYVADRADTQHAREVARAHASSIGERIETIRQFQLDHPERTGLGCHTCPPGVGPADIGAHLEAMHARERD
jgi:hypothetical protein